MAMDQELENVLTSMFQSLQSIRDSLQISTGALSDNGIMIRESIQTNSYLADIAFTLREQLEFFRERESEREFEKDTRQASAVQPAESKKATAPDSEEKPMKADGKIGGFLSSIGIGLGSIARGLIMFGNPKVILGIVNLGLAIAAIGSAVGLVARYFGEDITGFIHDLVFAVGSALVEVAVMVGENKDALMDAMDVVLHFVDGVIDIFADFLKDIQPLIESVLEILTDFIEDMAKVVAELLSDVIDRLLDSFDNLINKLPKILRSLEPIISRILDSFDNLLTEIRKVVEALAPVISDFLDSFDNLVSEISETLRTIMTNIEPILKELGNVIETVGDEIEDIIDSVSSNLEGLVSTVGNEIKELIETVFAEARQTAESFSGSISEVVDSVLGGIKDIIEQIGDTIQEVFDNTTKNITELSEIDGDELKDTAQGITAIALAIAAFAGANLAESVGGVASAVADGVSKLFGGEGSIFDRLERFKEIGPGLDVAAEAINTLREAIEQFSSVSFGESGLSTFADSLYDNASKIRESMDTILGEGGFFGFGKGPGSAEERIELLKTLGDLSSAGVAGSPRRSPAVSESEREARARSLAATTREALPAPNIQTASNVQDSFNTNQVFITNPGGAEATLDRIFAETTN